MAEKGIELLKAFGKEPTLPATSADFQLKLSYAQFVDVVESALNITDGGTVAGPLTLGNIQSAANTDATFYQINGSRGEIRSQLQGSVAADTGFTIQLNNSSILSTSLIVANIVTPSVLALSSGAIITGSVVTANVISAGTGSLNFFNTGAAMLDNSVFTASFAIL
tara:strand:+ start:187 stop:684 length:498 start_codon:yes stop_codon:yes gene_type:complete